MPIWTLALKDLRLLVRDTRAVVILLAMPLIFMTVLGLALGEGFGQKPDDRLRVSIIDEDRGQPPGAVGFPGEPWSHVVRRDLEQTAGIRVEIIPTREQAERLVRRGQRSAVLVFGPDFSERVHRCSFLDDRFLKEPGINPFFRDGVDLGALHVEVLRDPTQRVAASIIEQVAQVTLLRVVLPWMIGRGFDEVTRQMPLVVPVIERLFPRYGLRAKTWAALTQSKPPPGPAQGDPRSVGTPSAAITYQDEGEGLLRRGSPRYQIL